MIDYGYLNPNNQNTLQSIMKHKKNNFLENLGKADVTAHVNFSLLKEFFLKNGLKIEKIVTQKKFLENMGILERAEIIAKKILKYFMLIFINHKEFLFCLPVQHIY